jgi:hypothetical protein
MRSTEMTDSREPTDNRPPQAPTPPKKNIVRLADPPEPDDVLPGRWPSADRLAQHVARAQPPAVANRARPRLADNGPEPRPQNTLQHGLERGRQAISDVFSKSREKFEQLKDSASLGDSDADLRDRAPAASPYAHTIRHPAGTINHDDPAQGIGAPGASPVGQQADQRPPHGQGVVPTAWNESEHESANQHAYPTQASNNPATAASRQSVVKASSHRSEVIGTGPATPVVRPATTGFNAQLGPNSEAATSMMPALRMKFLRLKQRTTTP